MSEEKNKEEKNKREGMGEKKIRRRDILLGLSTLPFLGGFLAAWLKKRRYDEGKKQAILKQLGLGPEAPAILPEGALKRSNQVIRLGIIGAGSRGEHLLRCAGFVHPDWLESRRRAAKLNPMDKSLEIFLSQQDTNCLLTAVCDVFEPRAERALEASKHVLRNGQVVEEKGAKRYRHYQELLNSPEVDAVIIATPDHLHAQMALDAVAAGKHIYLEKCMTRTADEAVKLYDAVKASRIVFQLGHQQRQQESHVRAREIVRRGLLGKITLVETTTNRNSPEGAWQYEIPENAGPHNIDWEQFLGPAPRRPFDVYRFFRWRCWFDYGTGLSGDLLSHEYDAVNQILELGIPKYAVASGGIYFFDDGRDVPDVFHAVFEYPDRDLTLIYSATLASDRYRGRIFMGHDAWMEVGETLTVTADPESTKYKEFYLEQLIEPSLPLFSFRPGAKGIDTVTSASERYFATRGLLYSYKEGRRVDLSHLHVLEWLDCIREGRQPSCNIDRGFEEAITCHMATEAYLRGRRVEWDPVSRRII
jgi:predicted dehydrogenase